ncbi:MAG: helix-turn-helix domain-containing protein [Anaerolineae bacterium]|nr:helix-turn-helix domain-containing protein [Anaerolineae bacterium]NIN97636.1 helix-turn-helix domain-containing protein [Anaerolineae bacterium]NIQ80580.1 helix-turn-helix domain-containing protein [Anaerolineae bacterium]
MPVQSVDRAVAILNALSGSEGHLGVTELSNQLDLHKSTVHRLLVSLKKGGLVERDAPTRKYRLGVRLVELGHAWLGSRGLPQVALPYLHYLADELGEITYLAILQGDVALNVLQVPAPHLVQSVRWLGRAYLHSTSTGKVFLAHMPEDELDSFLGGELRARTGKTITDANELRAQLDQVREEGFATSFEEDEEGINAVAVPVRQRDGTIVAAIGVVGPSFRFTKEKAMDAPSIMVGLAREVGQQLEPRRFEVLA